MTMIAKLFHFLHTFNSASFAMPAKARMSSAITNSGSPGIGSPNATSTPKGAPSRDLQRGQGVGLPSGEAVARRMEIAPLTPEQIGLRSIGWSAETPLWYYILREALVTTGGDPLGPVGGRIVGEVIVT